MYLQSETVRTQSRMAVVYLLEEHRKMRIQMMGLETQLHVVRNEQEIARECHAASEIVKEATQAGQLDTLATSNGSDDDAPVDSNHSSNSSEANTAGPSIYLEPSTKNDSMAFENSAHVSITMDSESLPDLFHLNSSNVRLFTGLNTTASTLGSINSIETTLVDKANEDHVESSENPFVLKSSNEKPASYGASSVDNVNNNAKLEREEVPTMAQDSSPSVSVTRSRLRRKQPESNNGDTGPLSSSTDADVVDTVSAVVERNGAATKAKRTKKKRTLGEMDESQEAESSSQIERKVRQEETSANETLRET